MNNNLIKIITIFIIFFFICLNNTSSSCLNIVDKQIMNNNYGNTFYVGGSGPDNYSTIQSAINDTSSGDIVFVYNESSPYYENLMISKSIILIGEDKNSTIIDGFRKNDVIFILTSNIEIRQFTIFNSSENGTGIYIYKYANYVKITDNIIKGNYLGIYLYNPGYHLINPQKKLLGPNENFLVKNLIINNTIGISLHGSNNNIVKKIG